MIEIVNIEDDAYDTGSRSQVPFHSRQDRPSGTGYQTPVGSSQGRGRLFRTALGTIHQPMPGMSYGPTRLYTPSYMPTHLYTPRYGPTHLYAPRPPRATASYARRAQRAGANFVMSTLSSSQNVRIETQAIGSQEEVGSSQASTETSMDQQDWELFKVAEDTTAVYMPVNRRKGLMIPEVVRWDARLDQDQADAYEGFVALGPWDSEWHKRLHWKPERVTEENQQPFQGPQRRAEKYQGPPKEIRLIATKMAKCVKNFAAMRHAISRLSRGRERLSRDAFSDEEWKTWGLYMGLTRDISINEILFREGERQEEFVQELKRFHLKYLKSILGSRPDWFEDDWEEPADLFRATAGGLLVWLSSERTATPRRSFARETECPRVMDTASYIALAMEQVVLHRHFNPGGEEEHNACEDLWAHVLNALTNEGLIVPELGGPGGPPRSDRHSSTQPELDRKVNEILSEHGVIETLQKWLAWALKDLTSTTVVKGPTSWEQRTQTLEEESGLDGAWKTGNRARPSLGCLWRCKCLPLAIAPPLASLLT